MTEKSKDISKEEEAHYNRAFELKNSGKYIESINEFKKIIDIYGESSIAVGMIAALYQSELDDSRNAISYARRSIELSPKSEMASLCLAHCLFELDLHEDMIKEIKRYINTGGKIDGYNVLFEENGLTLNDFIT